MRKLSLVLCTIMVLALLFFTGCESETPTQANLDRSNRADTPSLNKKAVENTGGLEEATASPLLGELNVRLEAAGEDVRVLLAEWITAAGSEEAGRTVFAANVGNKQLSAHWVPYDPNRTGTRVITWIVDHSELSPTNVASADAIDAIDRAMATWQNVSTSNIPLQKEANWGPGFDWGYVQNLLEMGGVPGWYADITHAGWLPAEFFTEIGGPGAENSILGVTFTFIWVDDDGNPTDMDNNGKNDVAFREIYYNNNFGWGINTEPYGLIDVEAIVLHEVGHGLSQAHFGKLFGTYANLKLHFAPEAVMNALYLIPKYDLLGTDIAGHSSIWSSWPGN